MSTIHQKFMLTVLRLEQHYYISRDKGNTTERLGQYIVNHFNNEKIYECYKDIIEVKCKDKWDKLFYEESYEEVFKLLEEICNEYRND